jgi:hypothetical protein
MLGNYRVVLGSIELIVYVQLHANGWDGIVTPVERVRYALQLSFWRIIEFHVDEQADANC